MNTVVRQLFRDLADTPQRERERMFAERKIMTHVRAEVISLLEHDFTEGESLAHRISAVADEALCSGHALCGPYRLVRRLGCGGMGAVYLAERHDGEIEHKTAIKLLRADMDGPAWRNRFLRERQLLAYLNHPSIARLLDAGHTTDGRPFLVMEYVDGVAIDEYAASLDLRAKLKLFLLVCDGVSHAHRRSIIHRDLKPSNILVDSAGHPKLLDFGIAKLLDGTTNDTRTVERMLTPSYASPEQIRGDIQTVATDVYSLGAVLQKLLTGRSPRESVSQAQIPSPKLPRDIDHILRKAMRDEPEARYSSVDQFARDVRAFLESKPVQARSAAAWYRISKFVRRYRFPVAASTIAFLVLWVGMHVAGQQQRIAHTRSAQVRQLTNKVLALDEVVGGLHSSSQSMHEVVALSKEYLQTFLAEAGRDPGLGLEVAEAYWAMARTEGICIATNPRQRSQAAESLRRAKTVLEPILSADPKNRKALLIAAKISHDGMVLADSSRRPDESKAQARNAVGYLDRLLALPGLSSAESGTSSELFYDIALSQKNQHLAEDAIRSAQRSIETAQASPNRELRLSLGLSMFADLLRLTGDLDGALAAIRQARANLERARFSNETERRTSWASVLGREGKLLGGSGGVGFNRPDEAIGVLRKAFDLLEEWARNDGGDAWSRMLFAPVGRDLGKALRQRDPQNAIAVYDRALIRLREVNGNPEARRGEAEILAGYAYALRRLNRIDEARNKIDTALRMLAETNDYPAAAVVPGEAADAVLRALADHLAETGQTQYAAEAYEDLLSKVLLSNPHVYNDLSHAVALSGIYNAASAVHRRNNQTDRAGILATLRMNLWQHWRRKLPENTFIRVQYQSAQATLLRKHPSWPLRRGPDVLIERHEARLSSVERNNLPSPNTIHPAVYVQFPTAQP